MGVQGPRSCIVRPEGIYKSVSKLRKKYKRPVDQIDKDGIDVLKIAETIVRHTTHSTGQ